MHEGHKRQDIVIPRGERTWFDTACIRIGYTHSKIATLFAFLKSSDFFLNAIFLTLSRKFTIRKIHSAEDSSCRSVLQYNAPLASAHCNRAGPKPSLSGIVGSGGAFAANWCLVPATSKHGIVWFCKQENMDRSAT